MDKAELQRGALQLSVRERLGVAETLLEILGDEHSLQPWQREILDERIAVADSRPEQASSWSAMRERIEKRLSTP